MKDQLKIYKIYYQPTGSVLTLMMASLFLAFLSLHHRPSLCSCPRPATIQPPQALISRLLMNPLSWTLCTSLMVLNPSPPLHTLNQPSLDPVRTVSVLWRVATADTQ